jgi:ATP-dependent DNA helicase RecG
MEHWSTQGLRYLKGVGPRVAEKLQKLGLHSQRDLLFHLPLRYEDRTFVSAVGSLQAGQRSQIEAEVLQASVHFRRQGRSRRVLVARLADDTGMVTARFFYFSAKQQQLFEKGNWLRCFGEVRLAQGELEMIHPEVELIDNDNPPPLPATLTPIYPTTEGLHQLSLKRILQQVIEKLRSQGMDETLPQAWLDENGFPDFASAMLGLHSPQSRSDSEMIAHNRHPAQHRFVVEELAAHRLALLERRRQIRGRKTPKIVAGDRLTLRLLDELPFELTRARPWLLHSPVCRSSSQATRQH